MERYHLMILMGKKRCLDAPLYNVKLLVVIRVAIRAGNDPRGPILWVQTIGFQQYCTDVLPNEWIPSWDPQALEAGAMAVKMFA